NRSRVARAPSPAAFDLEFAWPTRGAGSSVSTVMHADVTTPVGRILNRYQTKSKAAGESDGVECPVRWADQNQKPRATRPRPQGHTHLSAGPCFRARLSNISILSPRPCPIRYNHYWTELATFEKTLL